MDVVNKTRQTNEIRKCARDPLYFFNNFVKVSHPTKGPLPFATYPFQDDCTRAFLENRFVIINKSRQLGLSTLAAAYAAWLLLFFRNKEIIIMATKLATAMNFVKKVKFTISNLPKWLVLPKIAKDNERSMIFGPPSNSRIEAIPTAADAGRSEALSLLIVDEAAHVDDFEELWKGLYPTLSCVVGGTKVLMDDGFHDIEEFCAGRDVGEYFGLCGKIFGKNGLEELSHGYVSPESDTLKITTRHGLQLEVTHEHPLWCIDAELGGKMVKARDLKPGDHLRVQHSMQVFGDDNSLDHPTVKEITPELAYMLGGWVAEGWIVDPYRIEVCNTDEEFRRVYLENTLVKAFQPAALNKVICYSKEMVDVFKACGVDPKWKCDTKRVPKKIWRCTREIQASFLSGYFDGDGCVGQMASACSTSLELLHDVQQLLLNMGFIPQVTEISQKKLQRMIGKFIGKNKRPVQSVRRAWSIFIARTQSRKFLDEIGFRIVRKQEKLRAVADALVGDDWQLHRVPLSGGILERIQLIEKESKKKHSWFCSHGVFTPVGGLSTTKDTLGKFSTLLEKNSCVRERDTEFLNELINGDFIWDEIVKIEKSNNKTYDFTVPNSHTFIQNCILGSNTGGRALIISTPRGVGNMFHKLWVDAEAGANEFHAISLPWTVHPERDQAWYDEQASNMSPKAVAQELMCDFLASGDTYLDASDIAWVGSIVKPPISREGYDKNVWVWEQPINDPAVKYIVSADVGRGDSGGNSDFSAFHVLCVTTGEVVAEFQGRIRPDQFAKLMLEYLKKYNNALAVPERNTYGHHVITELVNAGYTNLYFKETKGVYIGSYIPPERTSEAGFDTQRDSRKQIVAKLEEVIRNRHLKVYSSRFYNELKTFITQNDKPQAQKSCHDDLIISLAIGSWLFDASDVHSQFAAKLGKAMLAGFGVNVNEYKNMAGNGNEVIPSWVNAMPYLGKPNMPANVNRLRSPDADPTDISWLFNNE